MTVRQLEFALLQLIQQMNEFLAAVKYTLKGKLAVTLVNPTTYRIFCLIFLFICPTITNWWQESRGKTCICTTT